MPEQLTWNHLGITQYLYGSIKEPTLRTLEMINIVDEDGSKVAS